MKIKTYAVVERTKGGAIHITAFGDAIQARDYYNMCDNARGCHCKSKKECEPNIIHSIFEIVVLEGKTKRRRCQR